MATPEGEVDLLALEGDRLVLVEVKSARPRVSPAGPALAWRPADRWRRPQQLRLLRAARFLAARRFPRHPPRLDLIEVLFLPPPRGIVCLHAENAVGDPPPGPLHPGSRNTD